MVILCLYFAALIINVLAAICATSRRSRVLFIIAASLWVISISARLLRMYI